MAETLAALRREGVAAVGRYLLSIGGTRLTPRELAVHDGAFDRGWRWTVRLDAGIDVELAVLLPPAFPFAAPRLAVIGGSDRFAWAHLEDNGLLCVLPEGTQTAPEQPLAVVQTLIHHGLGLIEDCAAGCNVDDFRDEALAYWNRAASAGAPRLLSLLRPEGTHREVVVVRLAGLHLVAETAAAAADWLAHRGAPPPRNGWGAEPALLLWPAEVPLPADYPSTGAGLRNLFRGDADALPLLSRFAASGQLDTDIVLGLRTARGVGFAAVHPAAPPRTGRPGWRPDPVGKGFRPGHVPPSVALLRTLSLAAPVHRHIVERADHTWVHGRDRDDRQQTLRRLTVAYVGVGSLGGHIAELLARSGVGRHILIDGENLGHENLGRHVLGAADVGTNKAIGMEGRIHATLPHLLAEAIPRRLTPDDEAMWELLREADLIVATTGDAATDLLLDTLHREGGLPPVLYGWLEPHAAAAHAVLIDGTGGCLRCGLSPAGAPDLTVTTWDGNGLVGIPACGGRFSPYGAPELAAGASHVVDAALDALLGRTGDAPHRVWVGDIGRALEDGAAVSDAWRASMGNPGRGRFMASRSWPVSAACPHCGGRTQVVAA